MSTPHVLVVEDNEVNEHMALRVLERAGVTVCTAKNGQEGVDMALKAEETGHPFDVIFMDMAMPVLGGIEATKILRGKGYARPIVALTACLSREQCLEAGCDAFLAKPVETGELLRMVYESWRTTAKR